MSDLYFKQKCEHELNDTLCDTKCEAYIGGEGWYLVLADGDLMTRAEWEATAREAWLVEGDAPGPGTCVEWEEPPDEWGPNERVLIVTTATKEDS